MNMQDRAMLVATELQHQAESSDDVPDLLDVVRRHLVPNEEPGELLRATARVLVARGYDLQVPPETLWDPEPLEPLWTWAGFLLVVLVLALLVGLTVV